MNPIRSIIHDGTNLWAGSENLGLAKYDGNEWNVYNTSNSDLPSNFIYSIKHDGNTLWLGTWNGLVRAEDSNWIIYYSTLLTGCIRSIVLDEKVLWVGTSGGLVKFEQDISSVDNSMLPIAYNILPNYPNPFNPSTTIRYSLPDASHVTLNIYDITGRLVEQLVNQNTPAGYHTVTWDASGYSSGIYFARMQAGDFVKTQKMVLMK
jgi:hypothetical protein